jgi:GNAT superfamily N-acetyltransferase
MSGVTAADPIDLSIQLFRESWRLMFADRPGAMAASGDGVDYVFSGLPIAFFNIAFMTARGDSAEALQARGRAACAWAAGKGLPWLLLVTHEALAPGVDPAAALDGAGLAPMLPLTGMMARRIGPGRAAPAGLQLQVPEDDLGCSAMLDINSAAYGMSLDAGKSALGRHAFWASHAPALGLVGGKPVSCAAVIMTAGYRYVALVATDPPYQKRGYGEAVMRHALDAAVQSHGDKPTFLHATDAGRPIYARMGYETVSTHTVFIEKRFLDGH